MASYKIVRMGDRRGVGGIIEKTTLFVTKQYIFVPGSHYFSDKWVNSKRGSDSKWASITSLQDYYLAQYEKGRHNL